MKRNLFPIVFCFFIIGIILAKLITLNLGYPVTLLFLSIITFLFLNKFREKSFLWTALIMILFIDLGYILFRISDANKTVYPFKKTKITNYSLRGIVVSAELPTNTKFKFVVKSSCLNEVTGIWDKQKFLINYYDSTKALNTLSNKLDIGDSILIKGTLIKPKNRRNPFEFDYEKYLHSKGISAIVNVYKVSNINIKKKHLVYKNFFWSIRRSLNSDLLKLCDRRSYSLIRGLILADRGDLDYNIKNNFINAGVVHVLAVSGLHVGLITLIFWTLFGRLNIYLKFIATALGLWFFVGLTNAPTSVVRAALMSSFVMISFLMGRKYNIINSVLLSAIVILFVDPEQLFNPGFQLSYSAVLSIILIYPIFGGIITRMNIKNSIIRYLFVLFFVSISAQIGTLPFTVYYFHKFSIAGILSNLLVIPLVGVILSTGLLVILFLFFSNWIASVYATSASLLTEILFSVCNFIGESNISHFEINHFSIFDSFLYFVALASIIFLLKTRLNTKITLLVSIIIGILFYSLSTIDNSTYFKEGELTFIMIDVGQGDSFFLRTPEGKNLLIDCGERHEYFDTGERIIYPLLSRLNIHELNYMFISHLDNDHYGGSFALMRLMKIDTLFFPYYIKSKKDDEFIDSLKKYRIPFEYYHKREIHFGKSRIMIFNDTTRKSFSNRNDKSGFFKYIYNKNSILFTGDLSERAEKEFSNQLGNLVNSDVLKVAHHGSKSSTSLEFLNYVNPEIALLSVGEWNKFGHPDKIVLERLKQRKIKIFRTDTEGAVILKGDGKFFRKFDWREHW